MGLRSGEAVALKFENISWEKEHILINSSYCKQKGGMVPPKSGKSRIVPMSKNLASFLKKLLLKNNDREFVLPRIKSWMNGGATKVIQNIQNEIGVKRTNYHSLRASFITILLRKGVSLVQVREMVGHRDLKTTERYIRLDATDLVGATDCLELHDQKVGKVLHLKKNQD